MSAADDIAEQTSTCTRCDKAITRYGSDGYWFTDSYECAEGGLHVGRCSRCMREAHPWPLGHRSCSPKDWAYCISTR